MKRPVACLWCRTTFQRRQSGGSPQRFCSKDCRQEFYAACRNWAVQEYEAGRVSLSALRRCAEQRARCTEAPTAPSGPSDGPEHPQGQDEASTGVVGPQTPVAA